jgi:hypothetical protein
MPVRAIVILEQTQRPPDPVAFRYLLRADVPASRQIKFAKPDYVSAFVPFPPDTDPDLDALRSGAVVEVGRNAVMNAPLAAMKARLEQEQALYQTQVTTDPTYSRYGTWFFNGSWTTQGA